MYVDIANNMWYNFECFMMQIIHLELIEKELCGGWARKPQNKQHNSLEYDRLIDGDSIWVQGW